MKTNFLVGYDIADPKRLRKTAKIIQEYGNRVQYSFFHCLISKNQKRNLIDRISKIINNDEDQLILIPITKRQLQEMECIGIKEDLSHHGIIIV
ncbi:CRISPR-associated protein Cas2 [Candidatus Magnetomorum sp. HK-1]|nr:CRISPR-associated protein Cas2 [Candidatus Magnetomorum sp. HK-1]